MTLVNNNNSNNNNNDDDDDNSNNKKIHAFIMVSVLMQVNKKLFILLTL